MLRRLPLSALLLLSPAALAASPDGGAVRAYTCFIAYSAEMSAARSDAGRSLSAAPAARIATHLDTLDLDHQTRDAAIAAGRAAWQATADKAALRRSCDRWVETLPTRD